MGGLIGGPWDPRAPLFQDFSFENLVSVFRVDVHILFAFGEDALSPKFFSTLFLNFLDALMYLVYGLFHQSRRNDLAYSYSCLKSSNKKCLKLPAIPR